MLYVLKKEQIEHARTRALAQAVLNKEKGKEVFDEYMNVAFPWLTKQKSNEKTEHVRILMEEVKKGGLGIKPLWQGNENKIRSRMKTRVVERPAEKSTKTRESMNQLYAKLGKVVPV